MKLRFSLAVALAVLAGAVEASPTSDLLAVRRVREKSVKMGYWHADLNKARAYAEANGMPLIAVWSNGEDCSHCLVFEQMAMAPVFQEWMKTSGYVFYFGVRDDGPNGPTPDGQEGYHGTSFYWCRMKDGGYDPNSGANWPYVRIYWRKKSGSLKVDMFKTGAAIDGEYDALPMPAPRNCVDNPKKFVKKGDDKTYNPSARYFIDKLTNKDYGYLRNYVYDPTPTPPAYAGGEFAVSDVKVTPKAGMELECGGAYGEDGGYFTIPLSRTNTAAQASVATNRLTVTYPSGMVKSNEVVWAAGQSAANVLVRVNDWYLREGEYATVVLSDAAGKGVATNHVKCVAPVANSPANPYWIGERTAETLAWGEWTMDVDAATDKVNARVAQGKEAYTLLLVGGPLWCPDCQNLEEHLIASPEFNAWATSTHRIACVAIDEPYFKEGWQDSPSLLSHEVSWNLSGSSYLTRKLIPLDGNNGTNATEVLARNRWYIENDTDHGGLCLPEATQTSARKTKGWKAGIPCLILMRPDGSIAGRISQFSNSTTKMTETDPRILVRRLEEMLQQAKVPGEERNDSWKATGDVISGQETKGVTNTLSFTDAADYYRINATKGTDIIFQVEPQEKTRVIVSVINADRDDPDANPVSIVTNEAAGADVALTAMNLPSANCFLKVSYPVDADYYPTDPYYALGKDGSTLSTYAAKSYSIWRAEDVPHTVTNDTPTISMHLTKGQAYKLDGLTDESENEYFRKDEATGTLVATSDATVALMSVKWNAAAKGYVLRFQEWNPGAVGFTRTAASMNEPKEDVDYVIPISRLGGVSGTASVKIGLVPGESTSITDGTVYVWADQGRVFTWNEGEDFVTTTVVTVKHNTLSDGDQKLTFALVPAEGSDAVVNTALAKFALTIREDDEAIPGVLSLDDFATGSTVWAPGGSELEVSVARLKGADGVVGCSLKATGGATVSPAEGFIWQSRESTNKSFKVTLPAYAAGGGNTVTLTLVGQEGSRINAEAKYFAVRIVPGDGAVQFSAADLKDGVFTILRTRYVAGDSKEVSIDLSTCDPEGVRTAKKVAGTLPPGMNYLFDMNRGPAGALVFSGTPTKAGLYEAVFQAFENGNPGGMVDVFVEVTDPAAMPPQATGANPTVAESRTFNDILVVDPEKKCLAGLVTLTVPRSGRLSAKYRKLDGATVSFLSETWAGEEKGVYSAELHSVGELPGATLSVTCSVDAVTVTLADPDCDHDLDCYIPTSDWSAKNAATNWAGLYNVSLPHKGSVGKAFANGDAYVQLRMQTELAFSRGTMTYAGVLPNGRAFSGSATLSEYLSPKLKPFGPAERALALLSASSSDVFSGAVLVDYYRAGMSTDACRRVYPLGDIQPWWDHVEPIADEGPSYSVRMDAVGCLYDPSVDFVGCCTNKFGTQSLTFFAMTTNLVKDLEGFAVNTAGVWAAGNAGVTVSRTAAGVNKIKLTDPTAAARNGLTLSFDRANGLVSGQLRIDFTDGPSKTASYRALVMPGWGTRDCTACKDRECDQRPFISGACWFADDYSYVDAKSRTRAISVQRGVAVSVGVVEGK